MKKSTWYNLQAMLAVLLIFSLVISLFVLLEDKKKMEKDISDLTHLNETLLSSNSELQDEIWNLKTGLEDLSSQVIQHKRDAKLQEAEIEEINKKSAALVVEKDKLLKQVESLKQDKNSLSKKIEELESRKAIQTSKVTLPKTKTLEANTTDKGSKETPVIVSRGSEGKSKSEPKSEAKVTESKTTESKTSVEGKTMYMNSTAYTAFCEGCSGVTRTGIDLRANPGLKVIAVDPSVIPLGTKVHVEGYGYAIAGDTGGAIKGNKIDVYVQHRADALSWGRKQVKVTILK